MKLSVDSDALVMPRSTGLAVAGGLPGRRRLVVLVLEDELVHQLAHHEVGAAHFLDAHAPEHLAHDDLDVLVVDGHALQAVDLLHLVHEIALQLAVAEDGQVVVRVRGAVHQRLARLHPIALVHRRCACRGE